MESTLSVTNAAYNSGRRSRSNSFNSQQTRDDLLPPTQQELSPDPHTEGLDANHSAASYFNVDNLAAFKTHRRHASDVSSVSGQVAVSPSILSLPYTTTASHNQLAQSHSPSQPATIFTEEDNLGLEEALNSTLFMVDDYTDTMPHHGNSGMPYGEQKQHALYHDGAHMYNQDLNQQMPQFYDMGAYTASMMDNSTQMAMQQQQQQQQQALAQQQQHDDTTLLAGATFDNPAIYGERLTMDQLQRPFSGASGSSGQRQSQRSSFNSSESQPNRVYRTTSSQQASPAWPRQHVQSPPAMMLNVPGRETMYQSAYDRKSSFPDTPSFDNGSMGDLGSPAASGMGLSRSNSVHSQFSPQYDVALASAPTSPFVAQDNFIDPQRPEHYIPNYDSSAQHGLSPAQVYDILGNYNTLRAAQQNMAYAQSSPMPISGAVDYGVFEAPDIAINPPTPAGTSYMGRAQPRQQYPFPQQQQQQQQQVPIITTTTAPTNYDIEQPDYHDPQALSIDRQKQQRGRSHSDSRLMVHHGQPRSHSRSSQHSSSSRSPSRNRATAASPGLLQRPSGGRISKSADRHRRASWSGAPDGGASEGDETDVESHSGSSSMSKAKNPATFICPVEGCGKAFTRAYNLRSHQRTHTNERPFLCEVCNKGFARQHDRKRHEKLHSNERPFSCPGCKKKFARMDALSRHFKSEMGKDCIIGNPEYEHLLLEDT